MLGNLITYLTGKPPYMSPGQCEAFVDAIVYAMMADKVVDPDEMKKVEDLADKLPWSGPGSAAGYIRTAMVRATENQNFVHDAEPYLYQISVSLGSQEVREYTRKACLKVVAADGEETRTEAALVELINRAFA